MSAFVVYILWSPKHQKTYTGYTSNLIQRYYSHNALSKKGFTAKFRPWIVIHIEVYNTKTEARQREKFLKSGKGRKWIKENILEGSYPP